MAFQWVGRWKQLLHIIIFPIAYWITPIYALTPNFSYLIMQKLSHVTIHHSDILLERCIVAIHLEVLLQWVMIRSDSGSTTPCFMCLGDVNGYTICTWKYAPFFVPYIIWDFRVVLIICIFIAILVWQHCWKWILYASVFVVFPKPCCHHIF